MPLNIKGTLLPAESNIGSGHNLLDVLYMCRIYSAEEKKKKKRKTRQGPGGLLFPQPHHFAKCSFFVQNIHRGEMTPYVSQDKSTV